MKEYVLCAYGGHSIHRTHETYLDKFDVGPSEVHAPTEAFFGWGFSSQKYNNRGGTQLGECDFLKNKNATKQSI